VIAVAVLVAARLMKPLTGELVLRAEGQAADIGVHAVGADDQLQDGRLAWARLLHRIDPDAEPAKAQAVGSVYQALLSGVLVQWLTDPGRAPSASDLASGLRVIAEAMSPE
jgi:hypothetical protein